MVAIIVMIFLRINWPKS